MSTLRKCIFYMYRQKEVQQEVHGILTIMKQNTSASKRASTRDITCFVLILVSDKLRPCNMWLAFSRNTNRFIVFLCTTISFPQWMSTWEPNARQQQSASVHVLKMLNTCMCVSPRRYIAYNGYSFMVALQDCAAFLHLPGPDLLNHVCWYECRWVKLVGDHLNLKWVSSCVCQFSSKESVLFCAAASHNFLDSEKVPQAKRQL